MLTKQASGNAGPHLFARKGSKILQDFDKASRYYPFYEDYNLILKHAGYYADLAQEGPKREGPLVLVELGGGGPKSTSFLKTVKPDIYVPIDYAIEPLFELMQEVHKLNETGEIPAVKVQPRLLDFNRNDFDLPKAGRIIMAQFGCTLGNMPGSYKRPAPTKDFASCFSHYARQMQGPEDRLIIAVDHNDKSKDLHACYRGQYHNQLGRFYLERIREEISVSKEFSPDNFAHKSVWFPQNRLYAIGYTVLKTNAFHVGDVLQTWKKGEIMVHTNSYRFTTPYMDEIRSLASPRLRYVDILSNPERGRIHHHIFAPE